MPYNFLNNPTVSVQNFLPCNIMPLPPKIPRFRENPRKPVQNIVRKRAFLARSKPLNFSNVSAYLHTKNHIWHGGCNSRITNGGKRPNIIRETHHMAVNAKALMAMYADKPHTDHDDSPHQTTVVRRRTVSDRERLPEGYKPLKGAISGQCPAVKIRRKAQA